MTNFQNYKLLTNALPGNTSDRFWALSFEIWNLFGFWDLLFGILFSKKFKETEGIVMKLHSSN